MQKKVFERVEAEKKQKEEKRTFESVGEETVEAVEAEKMEMREKRKVFERTSGEAGQEGEMPEKKICSNGWIERKYQPGILGLRRQNRK